MKFLCHILTFLMDHLEYPLVTVKCANWLAIQPSDLTYLLRQIYVFIYLFV